MWGTGGRGSALQPLPSLGSGMWVGLSSRGRSPATDRTLRSACRGVRVSRGEGDRLTLPRLCPWSGSTSPPCVTWRLDWFGQEGATWSISLSGSGRGPPKLVPVLRPLADGWTGGCLDGRLGAEISKSSKAALQWSRWRGRGGVGSGSGGGKGGSPFRRRSGGTRACTDLSALTVPLPRPGRPPPGLARIAESEFRPPSNLIVTRTYFRSTSPCLGARDVAAGRGRPEGWQPLCLGGRGGDVRARRGRFQRAADGQIGGP